MTLIRLKTKDGPQTLVIPAAWTAWTYQGWFFRQLEAGQVVRWSGQNWRPVDASPLVVV